MQDIILAVPRSLKVRKIYTWVWGAYSGASVYDWFPQAEIGFYTDMSDAYITQVIRPRYVVKAAA